MKIARLTGFVKCRFVKETQPLCQIMRLFVIAFNSGRYPLRSSLLERVEEHEPEELPIQPRSPSPAYRRRDAPSVEIVIRNARYYLPILLKPYRHLVPVVNSFPRSFGNEFQHPRIIRDDTFQYDAPTS